MSIASYKREEKERNMKAIALRNKLSKLDELSRQEGKAGKVARREYEKLIASTPYVARIYVAKDESKKKTKKDK